MTIVTNIKGYINDEEWGVFEQQITLLTFSEISAMAVAEGSAPYTNTIAELNTHPDEYYHQWKDLDNWYNYLRPLQSDSRYEGWYGLNISNPVTAYYICYNPTSQQWQYVDDYGGPS